MKQRSSILGFAALLSLLTGCTVFDRESYSLIIRKGAHVYTPEKPPDSPPDRDPDPVLAAAAEPDPSLPDPRTYVRHDLDAVIDSMPPKLEAFLPFTWCYLHESSHAFESVVAIVLAPIEYPAALGAGWAYIIATGTLELLMAPLKALLPPPEVAPVIEERKKPPKR